MPYSTASLTLAADCDQLIALAEDEKRALFVKQTSLDYRVDTGADAAAEVASDLARVRAELSTIDTIIAAYPEGKEKDKHTAKKKTLEGREILLNSKSKTINIVARLDRELELERVSREIEEIDKFIAAVRARKTAIG
jgi:hypothetical protein